MNISFVICTLRHRVPSEFFFSFQNINKIFKMCFIFFCRNVYALLAYYILDFLDPKYEVFGYKFVKNIIANHKQKVCSRLHSLKRPVEYVSLRKDTCKLHVHRILESKRFKVILLNLLSNLMLYIILY